MVTKDKCLMLFLAVAKYLQFHEREVQNHDKANDLIIQVKVVLSESPTVFLKTTLNWTIYFQHVQNNKQQSINISWGFQFCTSCL